VPHSNETICGIFFGNVENSAKIFSMSAGVEESLNLNKTTCRSMGAAAFLSSAMEPFRVTVPTMPKHMATTTTGKIQPDLVRLQQDM
jgi:hypothetical protein